MLKTTAWPYPMFQDLACRVIRASCMGDDLPVVEQCGQIIILANQLSSHGQGAISLRLALSIPEDEVLYDCFGALHGDATMLAEWIGALQYGVRVVCKTSKYRDFISINDRGMCDLALSLEALRGSVEISPCIMSRQFLHGDDVDILGNAIVGMAGNPMILTIDENFSGEHIPVRWEDFSNVESLPAKGFIHVRLSESGNIVPELWLNAKYEQHLSGIIAKEDTESSSGLCGHGLRQFAWLYVWEKVLPWAIEKYDEDEELWAATRIFRHWEKKLAETGYQIPEPGELQEKREYLLSGIQAVLETGSMLKACAKTRTFDPARKEAQDV